MLSARSCARRAAWGVLLLLSGAGSALDIASPREAQTVVARAGAGDTSVRVHVDLGADVRVPEHGILALYLDGTRVLLACPGSVASAADCPTEGAPLSGRISLGLGSMPSGEHVLSAELLDAGMAPLAIARRVFTYVEEAEEDNLLPEGAPAFNMIVFSKDRACQLDQLLSSLRVHVRNVETPFVKLQVLYHHSSDKFADGYKAVKKLHPGVLFHQQGNLSQSVTSRIYDTFVARGGNGASFQGDYLRLLDDAIPYSMHFMDDMLMTDTFDIEQQLLTHRFLASRPEITAMSLRLHPGITKCYATKEESPPPAFDSEMTWRWREAKGDWGYPMSLDAHIFRTHDLSRLVVDLEYHNPNTLEGSLAVRCFNDDTGECGMRLACMKRGKVINIPANRVQDTYPNRYMADGPSAALLNTEFLFNRRLTSEHHWGRVYDSVHVPVALVFAVGTLQHETGEVLKEERSHDDL